MAVITFYSSSKGQAGCTSASMAFATYLGITQNKRTLYISTSLNDTTVKEAFWGAQTKKRSGLFGPNTSIMAENGIEGLDRVIRSNKISPNTITDYTKVVLSGRLEILLGYMGNKEQYNMLQTQYAQIISLATRYYENVIVDMDSSLEIKTKMDIIKETDVVLAVTTQKLKNIQELLKFIQEGSLIKKQNTLIVLGKYDDKSKYNAKNISRNLLRQKSIINTIPYNTVLFEAEQEGQIIDIFLRFLNLKGRDENTFLIDELKRLSDNVEIKVMEMQQMK